MDSTPTHRITHSLTIDLSSELYAALVEQVRITGQTETELLTRGLQQVLNFSAERSPEQIELASLEHILEQKLKHSLKDYIDKHIEKQLEKQLEKRFNSDKSPSKDISESNTLNKSNKSNLPIPTIRSLQIGDRVLVLEPDSPYYMAKLLVISTSLIRATVQTDTGEKTFLKRDLRFVEAAIAD